MFGINRNALPKPAGMSPDVGRLWDRIDEAYRWSDTGARSWSTAYHLTFGIATLAATLVTALSGRTVTDSILWWRVDTWISVLSVTAAVATALGGFGGFERKWHANRISRTKLWSLRTCIEHSPTNLSASDICTKLEQILTEHDGGIIKTETPLPAQRESMAPGGATGATGAATGATGATGAAPGVTGAKGA